MREVVQAPKVIRDTDYFGVGVPGLVPPSEGTGTKFLRDDGWADPPSGGGGVTDHGELDGLPDDDHPQYHNDTRGDARYYTKAQVDTSLASKQGLSVKLSAIVGAATNANRMIYWTGENSVDVAALSSFGRTLIAVADDAAARGTLGAQAASALLAAIAGLSPAANKLTYWTGASAAALTDLTALARTFLAAADQAAARAAIGAAATGDIPTVPELSWGNITGTLSDQTDLQAALDALNAPCTHRIAFHSAANGNITITNQPSTEQFLGNSTRNIVIADLAHCTQCRIVGRIITASASANNPRLVVKYSTAWTATLGEYSDIGTSEVALPLDLTRANSSGWVDLAAGAIADDVYITVTQVGGDGAEDPTYAQLHVEFR